SAPARRAATNGPASGSSTRSRSATTSSSRGWSRSATTRYGWAGATGTPRASTPGKRSSGSRASSRPHPPEPRPSPPGRGSSRRTEPELAAQVFHLEAKRVDLLEHPGSRVAEGILVRRDGDDQDPVLL